MVILFSQRPSRSKWCRRTGRKPKLFSDTFYLILAILLGWVLSSSGAVLETTPKTRLYVDYSAKPQPEHLAAFDLCILDPAAEVNLEPGHAFGHRFLAYLSTVEARPGSRLSQLAAEKGIPIIGKNEIWGTGLMDVLHPAWLDAVVGELAYEAKVKGFDGFFLDTLDSAALLDKARPEKAAAHRMAIITLIKRLRERHPDAPIVVNRGFELLPDISKHISGVLVESVYRTCDPRTKTYSAVDEKDSAWLVGKIRDAQQSGLPVYAVDYVPETDLPLAKETAAKLSALGCTPFVTTIDLQGVTLAPLCEVSRRVLVLYGKSTEATQETFTATHLQNVLEWLGCEVVYQDVRSKPLTSALPHQVAGVIVDPTMEIEQAEEIALVGALEGIREQGTPILFIGSVPFTDGEAARSFQRVFGITGTMKPVPGIHRPRVAALDGTIMNGEAPVTPRAIDFMDIHAPPSARIMLSVRGENSGGREARFDPVFLASWGGAWLAPYVINRSFDGADSFQADAFALLTRWLGMPANLPVPDTTTLDGRRVLLSQVYSDGFAEPSHFPGHVTCAEVLRDRIFSTYALPTTVAINPGALRTGNQGAPYLNPAHPENIARTLFTLPYLDAALEGESRPVPPAKIKSALNDINKRLLTGGKTTRLMLWSDRVGMPATMPGVCAEHGVEWLDTSKDLHGSDAMHTRGFSGLYQGGYEAVLKSFEKTGSPRRLAPVNLQYHFRSGATISAVRALEKIHEWCLSQPLHPVTALDHAEMRQDAVRAKIFPLNTNRWLVTGEGRTRTFRLSVHGQVPDMRHSECISGWKQEGDALYVHTTGKPRVIIALTDIQHSQTNHLRLQESGADILFHELQPQKAVFELRGWSDASVTFAGIPPGRSCRLTRLQESHEEVADHSGALSLTLSPHTTFTLEILPPPHVASL